MTQLSRTLARITGGRLRIWYLTHKQQWPLAAALVVLTAAFGLVGHFDAEDARNIAEIAHARSIAIQREQALIDALPKTIFIIEAKDRKEALNKLSAIAGDVDVERAKLKGLIP